MRTLFWGTMGLGSRQMCLDSVLSHVAMAAAEPQWLRGHKVLAACRAPSPPCPGPAVNRDAHGALRTPRGLTSSGAAAKGTAGNDATQALCLCWGRR